MSADHVYRLDYNDVLDTHRRNEAECTLVVTRSPDGDDPADHAVVEHDEDGRVTGFAYKPDDPATDTIACEVIAYEPTVLREVLEELHRELGADSDEADTGLGDFGDHLVPRLVERGRTFVHRHEGYWRDLGQPHHYLRAHQDVLTDDVGVLVGARLAGAVPAAAAGAGAGARGRRGRRQPALPGRPASPGASCGSVLGPGVVVEPGAEVHDSVVFTDSVVRAGARCTGRCVDTGCVVEAGARLGDAETRSRRPGRRHPRGQAAARWWAPTPRGAGRARYDPLTPAALPACLDDAGMAHRGRLTALASAPCRTGPSASSLKWAGSSQSVVAATIVALVIFNLLVHGFNTGGTRCSPTSRSWPSSWPTASAWGSATTAAGTGRSGTGRRSTSDGGLVSFVIINLLTMLIPIGCLAISRDVLGLDDPLSDNLAANVIGLVLGLGARFALFRTFVFKRPISIVEIYDEPGLPDETLAPDGDAGSVSESDAVVRSESMIGPFRPPNPTRAT